MSDEAKQAKAEAKAAKAKAKSLRPFYKKKRFILLAIIVVIVIIAVASGGGSKSNDSSGSGSQEGSTSDTIGKGIGSADASSDIVDIECGAPDVIGMTYPKVTVKNNSSKASDYMITVVAESADGSMRYDSTPVFITALGPDQTMTEEGIFTNELPAGAVCKVTEVQRTAS